MLRRMDSAVRAPVDYIERTRALYDSLGHDSYRWVRHDDDPPFHRLDMPLSRAKVALVGSGGIYAEGQIAFHFRDDTSLRIIDKATPTAQLRATHFAYDLEDARLDPNVVFPLDRLRELEHDHVIGELSPNAYAFMGGIYSARKVREQVAPEIAERLGRDEVDVALFVPV